MGKEDVIKPMNIVNDNMSDTPETDAKWQKLCCSNLSWYYIAKNIKTHCQKKERERDEAREEVKLWQRERDEAITRRMETIMQCELYEQERDEAREALADWENAAAHVEADHPDERHCGCVPVLRKLLADARKERDEAREALEYIASAGLSARHIQDYAKEFLSKK